MLELKHLACYLPYRLKYRKYSDHDSPIKDETLTEETLFVNREMMYKIKPILRPLSEYKEIGWYDEDQNEINLSQYTDNGLFFHNLQESNDVPIEAVIDLMNQLFEGHFDIFGLIDQNLAIDINTLKEKV